MSRSFYLGEIGVGHEGYRAGPAAPVHRRLAADGQDVVGNVMPLFLFPQQPFPDDAQGAVDQHAGSGAAN